MNTNPKYNLLFNQIVDENYLRNELAKLNRIYSRRYRYPVIPQPYFENYYQNLLNAIKNCNHQFHGYATRDIYDGHSGKVRTLHIPEINDRLYESVIMKIVEPSFSSQGSNRWTRIPYASITGRGLSACIRAIKNYIGCCSLIKQPWALKLDIRKYYESIDHNRMNEVIDRYFKNDRIVGTHLKQIVASFNQGLPIGTYSSQFLANLYLADLDFMCAQLDNDNRCNVVRYMDDIIVICSDYIKLLEMQKTITNWCTGVGLALHEPIVANLAGGNLIQMCGMMFGHNGVWIAPVTKSHMIHQYNEIVAHIKCGVVTDLDLGRAAALKGWISNSTEQVLLNSMRFPDLIPQLTQILHGDYDDRQRSYLEQ